MLKIMLYDMLLLNTCGFDELWETFCSFNDSSPMSDLKEDVLEYLDSQYDNVKMTIGIKKTNELKLRNNVTAATV